MIEPRKHAGFLAELALQFGDGGGLQRRVEANRLDGTFAPFEAQILGEVHGSHPTVADRLVDAVSVAQCRAGCKHRGKLYVAVTTHALVVISRETSDSSGRRNRSFHDEK